MKNPLIGLLVVLFIGLAVIISIGIYKNNKEPEISSSPSVNSLPLSGH